MLDLLLGKLFRHWLSPPIGNIAETWVQVGI
jgi:hypothetical protein